MKYNQLQINPSKNKRRVGRGIAAGRGKTAGRGTKGQGSRTGSSARPGFEGGQNPLMQRLPKLRGFKSHRTPNQNIRVGQLEQFSGKVVDTALLASMGLITNPYVSVKLINGGVLTKKVTVKLQAASTNALAAIEQAGGSFEAVERTARPVTSAKKLARTEK